MSQKTLFWAMIVALITLFTGCLGGPFAENYFGENPDPGKRLETLVFIDSSPQPDAILPVRVQQYPSSWLELKERHVVIQKFDYSCGAAAVVTMLKYYFGDDVPEQKVLDTIFTRLALSKNGKAEIDDRVENGLSMLDLQRAAADLGYTSAVAKITAQNLTELKAPIIVRLIKDDFKHFVVVRGVVEDRVFLADPIRGNVRMSIYDFLAQWDGPALFLGKKGFGLPTDHALAVQQLSPVRHELYHARHAILPLP